MENHHIVWTSHRGSIGIHLVHPEFGQSQGQPLPRINKLLQILMRMGSITADLWWSMQFAVMSDVNLSSHLMMLPTDQPKTIQCLFQDHNPTFIDNHFYRWVLASIVTTTHVIAHSPWDLGHTWLKHLPGPCSGNGMFEDEKPAKTMDLWAHLGKKIHWNQPHTYIYNMYKL